MVKKLQQNEMMQDCAVRSRLAIQLASLKELRLSRNLWRCDRCHVLPLLSTRALPGLLDTDKVQFSLLQISVATRLWRPC